MPRARKIFQTRQIYSPSKLKLAFPSPKALGRYLIGVLQLGGLSISRIEEVLSTVDRRLNEGVVADAGSGMERQPSTTRLLMVCSILQVSQSCPCIPRDGFNHPNNGMESLKFGRRERTCAHASASVCLIG